MSLDKKIPLVEVFGPTIQGEGHVVGQQTYFLRFGLCDYKCTMCDSMHAVDPKQVRDKARWLTQEEIYTEVCHISQSSQVKWITFSGGNPCIHDLTELVNWLHEGGFKVHVETQGTKFPDWLLQVDSITVSPKGPGMGEKFNPEEFHQFMMPLMAQSHLRWSIKVVVFDQRDLELMRSLKQQYYNLSDDSFYLSLGNPYPPGYREGDHPVNLRDALVLLYEMLLEDIMSDPLLASCRFLPQWHVILWGNKQGV